MADIGIETEADFVSGISEDTDHHIAINHDAHTTAFVTAECRNLIITDCLSDSTTRHTSYHGHNRRISTALHRPSANIASFHDIIDNIRNRTAYAIDELLVATAQIHIAAAGHKFLKTTYPHPVCISLGETLTANYHVALLGLES